jgi:hypothetical protein
VGTHMILMMMMTVNGMTTSALTSIRIWMVWVIWLTLISRTCPKLHLVMHLQRRK